MVPRLLWEKAAFTSRFQQKQKMHKTQWNQVLFSFDDDLKWQEIKSEYTVLGGALLNIIIRDSKRVPVGITHTILQFWFGRWACKSNRQSSNLQSRNYPRNALHYTRVGNPGPFWLHMFQVSSRVLQVSFWTHVLPAILWMNTDHY